MPPTADTIGDVPPRPTRIPLTRFVGVIGLFGLAFILVTASGFAWIERNRLLRDAATLADGTAYALADHAGRLFEVADVALAAATVSLRERDWDAVERDQVMQAQAQAINRALPYIDGVWLNDAEGRLRLTSFAFPAPASDARDRLVFRAVREPGSGLVVGDLITGKITEKATFLIARRLSWPDGSLRGMVSVTADLAYFGDYWRKLRLPFAAEVTLVRANNGGVLARYSAAGGARPEDEPAPPGVIEASSRVSELPLVLQVAFRRDAVLRMWHRWLAIYLPLAGAALAALGVLSGLAFRQGRREAAASAALGEARAQLAAANEGLEHTVARRTAELRDANEEVQRFAYLVSHDLRAPLVNVLGFTGEVEALGRELLEHGAEPLPAARRAELEAEFAEAIGFIRAGTSKMDRLLNHILKLAREGKRVLRPEPIDMTALVQTLADTVRYQAEAAGGAVTIEALPPIVADKLAVEQVFGNLLDNAVKYLDPVRAGRVTVGGRADGDHVRYTVRDNGRGIAPQDQERVFDLFRRAGKQDKPGEGIGLAHVKALVRSLGGVVTLRSEPGAGTSFEVVLPRTPAVGEPPGQEALEAGRR